MHANTSTSISLQGIFKYCFNQHFVVWKYFLLCSFQKPSSTYFWEGFSISTAKKHTSSAADFPFLNFLTSHRHSHWAILIFNLIISSASFFGQMSPTTFLWWNLMQVFFVFLQRLFPSHCLTPWKFSWFSSSLESFPASGAPNWLLLFKFHLWPLQLAYDSSHSFPLPSVGLNT